jgi:hypothetical protein
VKSNDYKLEGFFIVFFLFYLITTVLIRRKNRKTISNWYKSHESTLRKEFAGVGFGVEDLWKFENRGLNEAVSYVSGRRGIDYGWIKIELNSFDLVSWSYYKLRGLLDPTYRGGINKIVSPFSLFPLSLTIVLIKESSRDVGIGLQIGFTCRYTECD